MQKFNLTPEDLHELRLKTGLHDLLITPYGCLVFDSQDSNPALFIDEITTIVDFLRKKGYIDEIKEN